jgi:hypothetical protein
MRLNTSADPPAHERTMIYLARIAPDSPVCGYIAWPRPVAAYIHWGKKIETVHPNGRKTYGRDVPCPRPDKPCSYCQAGKRVEWRCFLPLWDNKSRDFKVVRLPVGALEQEPLLDPSDKTNLRGYRLLVRRAGRSDRSGIIVEMDEERTTDIRIPPCPDMNAWLRRLWGLADDA